MGYTGGRTYLSCEAGCGGVTWASYFSTPQRAQGDMNPDPRGACSQPPEYYNEAFIDYQDLARFTGSLQLNHRPVSWFHQRLTLGLDDVREDNQSITEKSELPCSSPTARGGLQGMPAAIINYTTGLQRHLPVPGQSAARVQHLVRRAVLPPVRRVRHRLGRGLRHAGPARDQRGRGDQRGETTPRT